MTVLERFFKKVSRISDNECWIWGGAKTGSKGQYGGFYFEGRVQQSHRVIWQILVGPIPEGLTINHICKETLCQNPDHLELKTRGENSNLGDGPTGMNLRRETCNYGHEFDGIRADGYRTCSTCVKIKSWGKYRGLSMEEAVEQYNPAPYRVLGDRPLTNAETQKRYRDRKRQAM